MNSDLNEYGHYKRKLTKDEYDKLNVEPIISTFQKTKLETEAKKNWDKFYMRHKTNFFKDRHWSINEFVELKNDKIKNETDDRPILLELGCGVGNFLFPLIEEKTSYFIFACDFSPRAIQFVKDNPLYDETKCKAFVADLTDDRFDEQFKQISDNKLVDVISLIFVLSAISPEKMKIVLNNCYKVLKPNGKVIFRDYALYDHAQLRFNPQNKIEDNFYFRIDLTRAYYFSESKVLELANSVGFKVMDNQYISKETINRKEDLCVPRLFIQSKFIKSN